MGSRQSKDSRKMKNPSSPQKKSIDLSIFNARVDCVTIKGLDRTKDDYVQRSIKNIFKARNFQEILVEVKNATNNLNELGCFNNVHALIDVSKGPKASATGYEIVFTGQEMSRITGTIGTTVDNNEGALTIELTTPNIFGRGEQVSINGSYSTKKTNDIHLKFWKAFHHTKLGDYKPETSISLFKQTAFFPWSKYKQNSYGLLFDLSSRLYENVRQSFQYEAAIKEIETIGRKDIPFFIREQCGPRQSSVVRYIVSMDQRDSTTFPTTGFYFRTTNEANLFGSNGVQYVMNNSHVEYNFPLFAGMSAQFTGRFGILKSNHMSKISINNLFTLGGPLSVRGFRHAGIGPREENCTVGTEAYWATGFHLWAPLPFSNPNSRFSQLFKTHLFYNCGNTVQFSHEDFRSSCGLGLAFKIGEKARIELNYCHPISYLKCDNIEKGFQFGIGYEFL